MIYLDEQVNNSLLVMEIAESGVSKLLIELTEAIIHGGPTVLVITS